MWFTHTITRSKRDGTLCIPYERIAAYGSPFGLGSEMSEQIQDTRQHLGRPLETEEQDHTRGRELGELGQQLQHEI